MSTATDVIVVGVDGSRGSVLALRWALAEARLRGAHVRVVHAWGIPPLAAKPALGATGGALVSVDEIRTATQRESVRLIEKTLSSAVGSEASADTEVQVHAVEAQPAAALVAESERAVLLVVGARGSGGFAGLALGSTSHQCVDRARCPVVVVPDVEGVE